MSIPGTLMPLFNSGATGYSIPRSLRFNSADSAYLSRTRHRRATGAPGPGRGG
jgi:hypothetical protein